MKLNPDCVRDILLALEIIENDELSFSEYSELKSKFNVLEKYSESELRYHVRQCKLSGLFEGYLEDIIGHTTIKDLSPKAHQILAQIRDDTFWSKLKKRLIDNAQGFSIDLILKLASSITLSLI